MTISPIIAARLIPIDSRAMSGMCCMVVDAERSQFAVARWDNAAWVYPGSGRSIGFMPAEYQPRDAV